MMKISAFNIINTAVLIILLNVFVFSSGNYGFAAENIITGEARAIDGQTLAIGLTTIRLYGIQTPKLDRKCKWPKKLIPCGEISRTALLDLIAASSVRCQIKKNLISSQTEYKFAICSVGGFDVARNMVHTGWAISAKNDPAGYKQTEARARKANRGLWRGTFDIQ